MEKYDITKPFLLPVGMYKLNKNPGYSFQLNRLVNMDLGDLDEVRRIGDQITDKKSWKSVLLAVADTEYEKGNIRSAMGFYRMVAFFMDYDDPDNNACWQKAREPVSGLIVVLLDIILYGFGWLISLLYRLKKGKGMDFFKTYYERIGSTNAYALARFLWQVDLRPLADKLTKDYLIIGGSKNTMSSRASIGRQMHLLKNARSITAREITEKELGADPAAATTSRLSWT